MLLSVGIEHHLHNIAVSESPETIDLYKWGEDYLLECLGDVELHEITAEDLEEFMQEMACEYIPRRRSDNTDPLSSSSIRNIHIAIHSLFNWALRNQNITGVTCRPDLALEMPKEDYKQITPLSPTEIAILKSYAQNEVNNDPQLGYLNRCLIIYIIFQVLLTTGMRVSELIRLTIQDFSRLTRTITVHAYGNGRGKTKYRRIKLPDEVYEALVSYLTTRPKYRHTDALILNIEGGKWTRSAIRHALIEMSLRAGISRVHPHLLRHTFSVEFIRNQDGTFSQLAYLLGESTFRMVDHYIKLTNFEVSLCHSKISAVEKFGLASYLS